MPTVILGREVARTFANDVASITLPDSAGNVRAVIKALDVRYPGIAEVLSGPVAVSIDGQIYENCLLEPVGPQSEICFMPSIDGG
ncbi:MAG: hypothetical protein CMO26_09750 [Thiotrichales bacterium]|nr:hypothetical protein [Thiotrichales bacterium]